MPFARGAQVDRELARLAGFKARHLPTRADRREHRPRATEDFLADDMAYGKPVACLECHIRATEKDYPDYESAPGLIMAKGGLIRHREQYEELLGIDPDDPSATPAGEKADMHCTACHDPHTTTIYQDVSGDPPGTNTACTTCHADREITSGGMTELACIDCHMPLLAKSAVAHEAVGTGPITGDIRSHIFKIDLTAEAQFTDDGAYAYPWITAEFACKTCHNGVVVEMDFTVEDLSGTSIHD